MKKITEINYSLFGPLNQDLLDVVVAKMRLAKSNGEKAVTIHLDEVDLGHVPNLIVDYGDLLPSIISILNQLREDK